MKCIIGLGNIGKEYENTRHNTGFIILDKFAVENNIEISKKMKKSMFGEGTICGKKVILVKPTTYMNLSGEALREIVDWYKISMEDVCIIYDDIDLKFGNVRFREKGSAGSHNGMKNIILHSGTENISRLRVGIESREEDKPIPLMNYVLSKFSKEEIELLNNDIYDLAIQNIINFLTK
jgi:PTH1 family peptidyl-tRNA hydrolase